MKSQVENVTKKCNLPKSVAANTKQSADNQVNPIIVVGVDYCNAEYTTVQAQRLAAACCKDETPLFDLLSIRCTTCCTACCALAVSDINKDLTFKANDKDQTLKTKDQDKD